MHPVLTVLEVGGRSIPIGTYGALLSTAVLVAALLAVRAASRAGIDRTATLALVGLTGAGALAGAHALFVCVEWARTGDPLSGIQAPGLVFFGAPFGGALVYAWAAPRLGVDAWRLLDAALVAIPTAHALGRIGCFFGGCCFGSPWEGAWAVRYVDPLAPAAHPPVLRHPAPLYEALALVVLAAAFALRPPRTVGRGHRIFAYGFAYGIVRIVVETWRGDAYRGQWLGLSTSQWLGALVALGCGGALWRLRRATASESWSEPGAQPESDPEPESEPESETEPETGTGSESRSGKPPGAVSREGVGTSARRAMR
ncbi:MAG: prolipoprotein diacylglyceryl transferase [Myxococcota bacterium]|nr:prolipoprotein diacylglyceryl transferase [Myxococcota bacterium]MDW8363614.1 prolipoprotein diacylglyceryl transferase [Myxococcales bacterium]